MAITEVNNATNNTTGNILANNKVMGKDDFLKMFVTQLKYQDPLNPIKNEAFAAQLAQFSQLESLQNMNTSLQKSIETNINMSQGINNSLATNLIGKTVKTSGSQFNVKEGDSAKELNFNLNSESQKVVLKIYNEKGEIVRTIEQHNMAKGDNKLSWNLKDDNNNNAYSGKFTYSVEAYGVGNSKIGATPFQSIPITGIKYVDGLANIMSDGVIIPYSQVLEVSQSF